MSRTKQPDYDVKPNFGTVLQKHVQLPIKRFMDVISAKIKDLNDTLNTPAAYDQYPGKIIPYSIPLLYGPLPLTAAGRLPAANADPDDGGGFATLAPLANPSAFVLPRTGPLLIDQEFTFEVCSLSAFGFMNLGFTADPGYDVPLINEAGVGDIFDNVLTMNGGAMPMDFFGGTFSTASLEVQDLPNIAFELEFFDRLRNRRMHDKKIPPELLQGGRFAHRKLASPMFFPKGSKVEVRLFVNEIRFGSALNTDQAYEAASFKSYVCLLLKGRQHIEIPGQGIYDELR